MRMNLRGKARGHLLGIGESDDVGFRFVEGPGGVSSQCLDRWEMRLLGKGRGARDEELERFWLAHAGWIDVYRLER